MGPLKSIPVTSISSDFSGEHRNCFSYFPCWKVHYILLIGCQTPPFRKKFQFTNMCYMHFYFKNVEVVFNFKSLRPLTWNSSFPREGDENCALIVLPSVSWIFLFWNKCVWILLALKQFFKDVYLIKFLSSMFAVLFLIACRNYKKSSSDQEFFHNICYILTLWRRNFFFLILAHPVYKMWIIQEPNKLALWNKLHFEEKNKRTV